MKTWMVMLLTAGAIAIGGLSADAARAQVPFAPAAEAKADAHRRRWRLRPTRHR
jgi:hypothetical protein